MWFIGFTTAATTTTTGVAMTRCTASRSVNGHERKRENDCESIDGGNIKIVAVQLFVGVLFW
jgi:hypothetical protein